jgi:hypothetical protein
MDTRYRLRLSLWKWSSRSDAGTKRGGPKKRSTMRMYKTPKKNARIIHKTARTTMGNAAKARIRVGIP